MSGDASKLNRPTNRKGLLGESLEDSRMFIGFADSPIMVCTRIEASELIDSTFYQLYEIWEKYHYAGVWPKNPQDMSDDIISSVVEMEKYYQRHFSVQQVQIKYLEALLKKGMRSR